MAELVYRREMDGGATYSELHEEDGKLIAVETMPPAVVERILDGNRAIKAQGPLKMGEHFIGARIPTTTFVRWQREWEKGPKCWGMSFDKFLRDRLNRPENADLRFVKRI